MDDGSRFMTRAKPTNFHDQWSMTTSSVLIEYWAQQYGVEAGAKAQPVQSGIESLKTTMLD
jgi:hypothetical protein